MVIINYKHTRCVQKITVHIYNWPFSQDCWPSFLKNNRYFKILWVAYVRFSHFFSLLHWNICLLYMLTISAILNYQFAFDIDIFSAFLNSVIPQLNLCSVHSRLAKCHSQRFKCRFTFNFIFDTKLNTVSLQTCVPNRDQQWIVFSLLISTHEILSMNESTVFWFMPTQNNIDL